MTTALARVVGVVAQGTSRPLRVTINFVDGTIIDHAEIFEILDVGILVNDSGHIRLASFATMTTTEFHQ